MIKAAIADESQRQWGDAEKIPVNVQEESEYDQR